MFKVTYMCMWCVTSLRGCCDQNEQSWATIHLPEKAVVMLLPNLLGMFYTQLNTGDEERCYGFVNNNSISNLTNINIVPVTRRRFVQFYCHPWISVYCLETNPLATPPTNFVPLSIICIRNSYTQTNIYKRIHTYIHIHLNPQMNTYFKCS